MTRLSQLMHLIWLFSFTDAKVPSLNLTNLKPLTPCAKGLRASRDNFLLQGVADASGTNATEWSRVVVFELGHVNGFFQPVCTVYLNITSTTGGDCISIPETSQIYNITINKTALSYMSDLSGRLRWDKLFESKRVYSNEVNIGKVYNPDNLHLSSLIKLTNTRTDTIEDYKCAVEAAADSENSIQMCCLDFASPCWSNISLDGQVVSWGNFCANYTFSLPYTSTRRKLTFSLSSCLQTDLVKTWNCTLQISKGTEEYKNHKGKEFTIFLAVAIGAILLTVFTVYMGLKQVLSNRP